MAVEAGQAQESIVKGDVLQKIAGPSFVAGSILLIVFNILHPRIDDPGDMQKIVQSVADNNGGFWEIDHLLLAVGILAVMIGVVGVYRSISTGGAAAWARLGFYGVVVSSALWTVLFALDGLGLATVVSEWESSAGVEQAGLFLIASSLIQMTNGLFTMTIVVFWLALTFLGVGMAASSVYPKWMGWALVVLGIATFAGVGIPLTFVEINQAYQIAFAILSVLTTVLLLIVGVWVTRKAW